MPMGIVSDDDLLKELNNSVPSTPVSRPSVNIDTEVKSGEIIDIPKKGRSEGDTNVPESLRALIGEEALLNGRSSAVALALELGISPSSASAYAVGASSTATYNKPKPEIVNQINKARERALKRASKTLNAALGAITQEKLDYTDADKLSGIAKDMSAIIKNLEPPSSNPLPTGPATPQFVVYAPQFRDERSFEFIQVQE